MGKQSRTKRSKRSQEINQEKQAQVQESKSALLLRLLSIFSPTGRFWASVVLFITLICAYYTLSTKISIRPSEYSLNTLNPFTTPFIIKNESYFSVNNVKINSKIRNLTIEGGPTIKSDKGGGIIVHYDDVLIPYIDSNHETTVLLHSHIIINNPIKFADIEVIVHYYLTLFPFWQKTIRYHFTTVTTEDRKLHWMSKSLSE